MNVLNPVSATIGVDMNILQFQYKGRKINMQIWDTAGQEVHLSLTRQFYRNASVCLFFIDLSDTTELEWKQRKQAADNWYTALKDKLPTECKVVLVGTKRDVSSCPLFQTDQNLSGFLVVDSPTDEVLRNQINPYLLTLLDSFSPIVCTSSKDDPNHFFRKFLFSFIQVRGSEIKPTHQPNKNNKQNQIHLPKSENKNSWKCL